MVSSKIFSDEVGGPDVVRRRARRWALKTTAALGSQGSQRQLDLGWCPHRAFAGMMWRAGDREQHIGAGLGRAVCRPGCIEAGIDPCALLGQLVNGEVNV